MQCSQRDAEKEKTGRPHSSLFQDLFQAAVDQSLSRVRPFVTPWTVACQAPFSMGFPRQEPWSGLSFPFPGDLSDSGIEPRSPALQADALTSEPPGNNFSYFTDDLHLSQ